MSLIRTQIDAALKQARIDRDEPTRNVIGMLKNKVLTELKSKAGVEETDELWKESIASYAKLLQKSIEQFIAVGEKGDAAKAEAEFELEFCQRFLPKKLDVAGTKALVQEIATAQGITDPKQMGRLMGAVMKDHKDEVDAGLVKAAAQEVLAG